MRISHKFSAGTTRYAAPDFRTLTSNRRKLHLGKSSGLTLAGVFICTGVVASAISMQNDNIAPDELHRSQSQESVVNVQADNQQTQDVHGHKQSTVISTSGTQTDSHSSTSVNTSTTVSSSGGSSSTQVTVNGHSVPVPTNGTVQQTVKGDGEVSVQVSSTSQTSSGAANNVFFPDDVFDIGGD